MDLNRRTLLSLPIAVPFLNLATAGTMNESLHFPRSDAQGGWRTLERASEIRKLTGLDKSRLDEAFQYVQTTSQHGDCSSSATAIWSMKSTSEIRRGACTE